uniref:C-type lectin domain-containing protein n=1 Tax=Sinocyclocheilus grahami TaxID=75366 RepID=A0A672SH70_SINGR
PKILILSSFIHPHVIPNLYAFLSSMEWKNLKISSLMFYRRNKLIQFSLASSRQYHFVNESKTWTEAQRYCRQNYTDLATIDNMEEMNRLINTVNGTYNDSAWIGEYDDVNSWRWSLEDNDFYQEEERDFRNWYHEPDNSGGNQLCVYMDYNGKWYDMSCDNTLPFRKRH